MPEPLHFKWEWNLKSSPHQLWPLLSDTNRFNRDAGLPSIEAGAASGGSSGKLLRMRTAGMLIEWEERPFEWIAPFEFGVERLFKSGPVSHAQIKVSLRPHSQPSEGTLVTYESWLTPRNFAAKLAIRAKMNWSLRPKLASLLKNYDARAPRRAKTEERPKPLKNEELLTFSKTSPLAEKLAAYIETADPLELIRIRPYALARKWGSDRKEILKVFLLAAHKKLLEFQWEMICPHCRGSEQQSSSLEIIRQKNYCRSCDLQYLVNFNQLVELTFRPNSRIRKASTAFFCTGGPKTTPHILVQQTVAVKETKTFTLRLEPGLYRLRGVREKGESIFRVVETGNAAAVFTVHAETIQGPEEIPSSTLEWTVTNTKETPFLFSVEHMKWADDRVPGSDIISMRLFRELFETQCLRPNQPIVSGELTFVFTDLKGSTKMYQEIGDPNAFGQVMSHFDILQDTIAAHEGTVVKTIGDSVMAVFTSPAKALLAVASAQKALAKPVSGKQLPLYLKAGIHKGPNLVVNLNNRLDYFGSSVNIAARLVSLSSGKDIIVSSEFAADPEAALWMNHPNGEFQTEEILTNIKGFGKENFTLFRMIPQ